MSDQADKAKLLRSLHIPGAPLVLPNTWDVGSARAVVDAGFPVVATASNAIAAALGYDDGEGAPSEEMMFVAQRIAASVDVPVTVDAEAGYGMAPEELVELLSGIGVVVCNIEDSDHANGGLIDVDVRATYIAQMRAAADRIGVADRRRDDGGPRGGRRGRRRRRADRSGGGPAGSAVPAASGHRALLSRRAPVRGRRRRSGAAGGARSRRGRVTWWCGRRARSGRGSVRGARRSGGAR
jgi:hypothetical protein